MSTQSFSLDVSDQDLLLRTKKGTVKSTQKKQEIVNILRIS